MYNFEDTRHPTKVGFVFDSGASTGAIPTSMGVGYKNHAIPTQELRSYNSVTGESIQPKHYRKLSLGYSNGTKQQQKFKVMNVKRPIQSAGEIVDLGHRVVLDTEESGGSYAYHKATGTYKRILRQNGVFIMPTWLLPAPKEEQCSWNTEPDSDEWRQEGNVWKRIHKTPRSKFYSPNHMVHGGLGSPSLDSLIGNRRTFITYEDGETEVVDDLWNTERGKTRSSNCKWTGHTEFWIGDTTESPFQRRS